VKLYVVEFGEDDFGQSPLVNTGESPLEINLSELPTVVAQLPLTLLVVHALDG